MSNMSWSEHPNFQKLDSRKKAIILDLVKDTKGKALNQTLPSLLQAQAKLKAQGLSFSKEETTLLMEILTIDLSPMEKAKVEAMSKMMKH